MHVNIKPRSNKIVQVNKVITRLLSTSHLHRYKAVERELNVPWCLVALIHNTEGSASFNHNIANGQRLGRRTTIVPKGHLWRTWIDSVRFVYKQQGWDKVKVWNVPTILYYLEKYNGWGYRKHKRFSQYLVGGSNIERAGRYVADGRWSSTTWSKQVGTALGLRELEKRGKIFFNGDDCIKRYYNAVSNEQGQVPEQTETNNPSANIYDKIIKTATDELGVTEIPRGRHNPRILEYWKIGKVALVVKTDEVPWCAGFIAFVLESVGIKSTRKANARSYLNWGKKLNTPIKGCVVVFKRGRSWQGHVAIFSHIRGDYIYHWGGNQSDSVSLSRHHKNTLLGYRGV